MFDEASLLDAYDADLRLMESRSEATVTTYVVHVRAFLHYLATTYPSVELGDVTKLQVRAWLLHEANRGIAPITRSTALFALCSFYRFLLAEDLSKENPAAAVTLPSPNRPRVEFYSDAEADAIIEWTSAQPGLRWQVGRVLLLTLRYTGLRMKELATCAPRRSTLTLDGSHSSARPESLA
ncbi:MAG: site-specific integrase [Acidimicrobiales bacterium]|jgi:site-specific recombinase XerD